MTRVSMRWCWGHQYLMARAKISSSINDRGGGQRWLARHHMHPRVLQVYYHRHIRPSANRNLELEPGFDTEHVGRSL